MHHRTQTQTQTETQNQTPHLPHLTICHFSSIHSVYYVVRYATPRRIHSATFKTGGLAACWHAVLSGNCWNAVTSVTNDEESTVYRYLTSLATKLQSSGKTCAGNPGVWRLRWIWISSKTIGWRFPEELWLGVSQIQTQTLLPIESLA